MIHLYGYGNKMVEGIWGTILKVHKIKRSQNFSAYRALQPLSAMIFSHFLKYCYRCLLSWITSYRIITIENNFFSTQNYFSVYWSRVYDLSIQKILTFLIQWFQSRSQRHQSYFHLVSYFNHFHLQEGVTFCINEFMFLLQRW